MFANRSLPWLEFTRLARARRTRLAMLAILVIPLAASLLQVWASPINEARVVRAAIVNEDKIVTTTTPDGKEMPVAVGRLLAGNLTSDNSPQNFDWVVTNRDDARTGLKDGTYGAVLTIPKSVSSAAISSAGKDPRQGTISIETNDTTSYLIGQLARQVARASTTGLNGTITAQYLNNLYLGFGTIKSSVKKAANGAGDLKDGAAKLAGGAAKLDAGQQELSTGLATLNDKTASLPADAKKLNAGAEQLDAGAGDLSGGASKLSAGATKLASGTGQLAEGTTTYASKMDQLAAACPGLIIFQAYCDGVDKARDAAHQIASAASQVNGGAGKLSGGASQLSSGAGKLSAGSTQLRQGTGKFAEQAPTLTEAIGRASDGSRSLADGSSQLSSGAAALADGSGQLATGLEKGADKVPTYTAGQREKLSEVVAQPVSARVDRLNPVDTATQARVPYAIAISMLLGAIATFMLLTPLSLRSLASAMPGWRITGAGLIPAAILALAQLALVLLVLGQTGHLGAAQPVQFTVVGVLAILTFTTLLQALVALFGRQGIYVAGAWVLLQTLLSDPSRAVGGLPTGLEVIRILSPLTPAIDGMQAAQTGGASITGPIVRLLVWMGVGLITTMFVTHRQRAVRRSGKFIHHATVHGLDP